MVTEPPLWGQRVRAGTGIADVSRLQYGRVALFRPWYGTPLRQNENDHWE
jgi:hypothetical protein